MESPNNDIFLRAHIAAYTACFKKEGVANGARTHDPQNHNLML